MDGISGIRNAADGSTNHDVENQAFAEVRALVEGKLKAATQKYNLTEREQEQYLARIELDARAEIDNRYGGPHQSTKNEKNFLERMEKSPTRAARAADDEESGKTFTSISGLPFVPDPELHDSRKDPQAQRDAGAHATEKTLEATLRKEGFYDAAGKFLKNGQEDGVLGRGATKALEKFEKAHGLHGNASDAAAIDALAASGQIDAKFAEALKQISGDGTLAKLETKFGSPVHVPAEHLASSRDKVQKPAPEQGKSQIRYT
jgi:phage shock protein A